MMAFDINRHIWLLKNTFYLKLAITGTNLFPFARCCTSRNFLNTNPEKNIQFMTLSAKVAPKHWILFWQVRISSQWRIHNCSDKDLMWLYTVQKCIGVVLQKIGMSCRHCSWSPLGGRLATRLVATISTVIFSFFLIGTSGRRCSWSPLGGRLATTLVDRYFHHYLLFPFFPFSPSWPFLIEGVLGSKNLFSKSWLERPIT